MTDAERLRILAHELRAPVAALVGLSEGSRAVPDTRRLLELAIAAARDIERVLSDPELVSLQREPVDVVALATGFASPSVRVHGDSRVVVEADPTRLRQALANLVDNGLRHGTTVDLEVRVENPCDTVSQAGWAVVEVWDDGPGVTPGIDPFGRGTSTAGSSGLGLWLAREIAHAHGGSLDLVEGGPGGRFRLALPLASDAR